MEVTFAEIPDSLRTHLQEIQGDDEEVLLADDIIDMGIITDYWLILTTERLITVSLGPIDTTSQSIDIDTIDHATINDSGYQPPQLSVEGSGETHQFELADQTNEFVEKINSLPNGTQNESETTPYESPSDSLENTSRQELASTLQTGEEMLQTAINAHLQGKQTVPRQRYQQAAHVFEEAEEIILSSDEDLFTQPIRVDVGDPTLSPNRSVADLPLLPETVTETLQQEGIPTLGDIYSTGKDLVAVVDASEPEIRTKLRLHETWANSQTITFENKDMVVDRADLIAGASRLV